MLKLPATTSEDQYRFRGGFDLGAGLPFNLGLALAITNLVADSDTTAVAANQVKVLGGYDLN